MDTSYIISKMNEYMFRLNQQIGGRFEKKLPKITDDWWQDLVFNNLSPLHKSIAFIKAGRECALCRPL